jgi:hypothetical protein
MAAALLAGTGLTPAEAHHSVAMYDGKRIVRITGTVTGYRWINPHVSIQLDGVADGESPGGAWSVEMSAPTAMMSEGWARDSLAIGDTITVFANPLREPIAAGPKRGMYVGAILPGGRVLGHVDGIR